MDYAMSERVAISCLHRPVAELVFEAAMPEV